GTFAEIGQRPGPSGRGHDARCPSRPAMSCCRFAEGLRGQEAGSHGFEGSGYLLQGGRVSRREGGGMGRERLEQRTVDHRDEALETSAHRAGYPEAHHLVEGDGGEGELAGRMSRLGSLQGERSRLRDLTLGGGGPSSRERDIELE